MSSIKPTLLADEMRAAFRELGTGKQAPETNRADEAAAWEYAAASELLRIAKVRKDVAQKAAVAAGVLPPPTEAFDPGTNTVLFEGQYVAVTLKVNQPTVSVDVDAFTKALREAKVRQATIDMCKLAAQKTSKPPHQFSAIFRSTRNGNGK